MARLVAFLPRLVILTVVWLLLTAALTFAAGNRLSTAPPPQQATTTAPAAPTVLVVPDVRRQAYVFAKGILEDAGFAWRVGGSVQGYASNLVAEQLPAPGTRVVDTGAPTISLRLARGGYAQEGEPENVSPFAGTRIRLADLASAEPARTTAAAKPAAAKRPAAKKAAAPRKPAAAKPATKQAPAKKAPAQRPAAFTFPGARPEPQHELPLPARARKLSRWLAAKPKPTDGNVQHWLYQHAWIVAGAKQGWWHGAEALRLLIQDDRRVFALWGIGARSEAIARAALAEVEARTS